jgi:hypothetical protein
VRLRPLLRLNGAVAAHHRGVGDLGNCYVVRVTGRDAPAILIHATYNGLALTLAVWAALS